MSDDEYYGEYDDFEEGLWDADPAPDLADDLAEHAAFSPVWQDDPVGELEPYYSDWEYYSDDYYDDDPVLKSTTLDGSVPAPILKTNSSSGRRGKKRKLDEVRESQAISQKGSLIDCIRGTVWAHEEEDKRVAFPLGQHASVALLKNWREMFKSDNGVSHTFGRGQLKRDESWANDLGLADMGLLNEREKPEVQEKSQMEQDNLVDAEDELQDFEDLDTADGSEQLVETPTFEENESDHTEHVAARYSFLSDAEQAVDDTLNPRKRRRLAGLPSPPGSNESNGAASEVSTTITKSEAERSRSSRRTGDAKQHVSNLHEEVGSSSALARPTQEPTAHSRKRKLSLEAEAPETPNKTSSESQAKRAMLARSAQEQDVADEKTRSARKLTRSQMK